MTILDFQRRYGGLSNDEMARLLGCSRQAVLHWKSGRRRLPETVLHFLQWIDRDCVGSVVAFHARWPQENSGNGSSASEHSVATLPPPGESSADRPAIQAPVHPPPADAGMPLRETLLRALRELADAGWADSGEVGRKALVRIRSAAARLSRLDARAGAPVDVATPRDLRELLVDAGDLLAAGLPPSVELEIDRSPAATATAAVETIPFQHAVANLATLLAEVGETDGGAISVQVGPRELRLDAHPHLWLSPGAAEGLCAAVTVSIPGSPLTADELRHFFETPVRPSPAEESFGMTAILHFLRRHRGATAVESTAGRGASVTLYLPPAPPAAR